MLLSTSSPALSTPATPAVSDATDVELPTDQIIVKYRSSNAALNAQVDMRAAVQRLSDAAAAPLSYVRAMADDTQVLNLPERRALSEVAAIADRLAQLPEIEYAEPDRILQPLLTPNDPQYGSQWHYSGAYGIDAPAAWDITTGSTNIVVAVIDTGILNHADLAGRTLPGYDFIGDIPTANDGNGRDANPSDPGDWTTANECYAGSLASNSSWHGTHVAGTIGAASNNNLGVAGINWVSKILPVRVLGKCGGYTSDILDGMKWAAGLPVAGVPNNPNPAKVLNLSLGGSGACDVTQQTAINAIVSAGTTVIVAAGNSNANASGFNPASCNNVIAVAATNPAGYRSYYSNYGAVVDIAAPGGETNVTSANGVLSTLNAGTTTPGADSYKYYQGTSMATPHVVGIASLVLSLIPAATPAQVSQILRNTVKAFPVGSTCNTSICGPGIASAFNSVSGLPRIADFSPKQLPMGSAAATLIITGANFINGSIVKWNNLNLATSYLSAAKLTAVISTALLVTPGAGAIKIIGTHATYGNLTTAAYNVGIIGDRAVYLPLVANSFPQTPNAPVLIAINNPGKANAYSVAWNSVAGATAYTLQEDDNISFSGPTTAYNGTNTSLAVSNQPAGTYYYRVKASNAYGDSNWSNVQSTVVQSAASELKNGNFESGATDWTQYSTHGWPVIVTSFPGGITPHGGSWAAWLGGDDDDISYIQQQVSVPPASYYLAYWHWIASADTCGYDLAGVLINGSAVNTYNLCSSADTGGWVKQVVDLGAYAGQSVTLQIRVETDGSLNSNLFVDDVVFQATATATALNGEPVTFDAQTALPKLH
jgi:serine protease